MKKTLDSMVSKLMSKAVFKDRQSNNFYTIYSFECSRDDLQVIGLYSDGRKISMSPHNLNDELATPKESRAYRRQINKALRAR